VKRGDWLCILLFLAVGAALAWPASRDALRLLSESHRSWAGFLAFGLCGPLGEALAGRFRWKRYPGPGALAALVPGWGLTGLALAKLFWIQNGGVSLAQASGLLPGGGYGVSPSPLTSFLTSFFFTGPFFTSLMLNAGPLFFLAALRRLAVSALRVSRRPDWAGFIREEAVVKPLLRLPLLTIVFMLPPDLWLLLAAWLGALLTGLLGLAGAGGGEGRSK
jgi:hypothetical protein